MKKIGILLILSFVCLACDPHLKMEERAYGAIRFKNWTDQTIWLKTNLPYDGGVWSGHIRPRGIGWICEKEYTRNFNEYGTDKESFKAFFLEDYPDARIEIYEDSHYNDLIGSYSLSDIPIYSDDCIETDPQQYYYIYYLHWDGTGFVPSPEDTAE